MVRVASAKNINVQPTRETKRPQLRVVKVEEPIAIESVDSRVKRRLEEVSDKIRTLENGRKVIDIKALSKLVGKYVQHCKIG